MAYTKQTWVDGDPTKPVSAARMGHIEDGIGAAHQLIADLPADPGATNFIIVTEQSDPDPTVSGKAEGTLWIKLT